MTEAAQMFQPLSRDEKGIAELESQANDHRPALVGSTAAGIVADLAFQRDIERLHRLGPRATGELLIEIGEQCLCRDASHAFHQS